MKTVHGNACRRTLALAGAATVGVALVACGDSDDGSTKTATADLVDTHNAQVGKAVFTPDGDRLDVQVDVDRGISEGFHGMHIHEKGVCDPGGAEPFSSAGGHLQVRGHTGHPSSGDLISINIGPGGSGSTSTSTSTVTLDDVNGKAIVIHADPDNFGNIPDRYVAEGKRGPDEKTMSTGDAGGRVACGVIKMSA